MTPEEFQKLCEELYQYLKQFVPRDSGNLCDNAVLIEFTDGGNECRIYVDEAIAPYMPFTNEPWLSPKWHGKQNPNEYWWDSAAESIAAKIEALLGDKLIRASVK